jgi:hypothetical protein
MGNTDDQKFQELLEHYSQKLLQLVENFNELPITNSSGTNTGGDVNSSQNDLIQRLDELIQKINDDPCIKDETKKVLINALINGKARLDSDENKIKIYSERLEQIEKLIDEKPVCTTNSQRSSGPTILNYLGAIGIGVGTVVLAFEARKYFRRRYGVAHPVDPGAMPPARRLGRPTDRV